MKLTLIATLLLASISQASICKSENGKLALIFRDSSLVAICNPTTGKSTKEVCAKDFFVIFSSAMINGTTAQTIYTAMTNNSLVTTVFTNKLTTVEFGADYAVTSFEGGNTITAPKGKFKLVCQ